tara:strand:+ start:507 stop:974 length:468 start_codon:yes stop_codon:yes gene_type:complete
MRELCFKQGNPITLMILGSLPLVFGLINYSDLTVSVIVLSPSLVLLGYSVSYKTTKEYCNYNRLIFFGIVVFKRRLEIFFLRYISFYASIFFKLNDWGPVSALGTKSNSDGFVIRIFNKEDSFAIYRSNNLIRTRKLAFELSELLVVELVDKTLE